jgi:putative transposase
MPRLSVPFLPQHVVQRGNNRQPCFLVESDRQHYLECMAKAARKYAIAIHAYVLMTNHVHLLVTPETDFGVSRFMQALGRRYVWYFNKRHERSGTLWEGRFHASVVQDQAYLLACHRYIELNPVRAGISAHPAAYRWSSYPCNGQGQPDPLLTPHAEYLALGRSPTERQAVYRTLVGTVLEMELLDSIRASVQSNRVFGSQTFQQRLEETLAIRIAKRKPGPPKSCQPVRK